jgi:SAM-dependent methyltransferase
VTTDSFDREFWERRWTQVLREHPHQVAARPPNAHLLGEIRDLPPGLALDAGCGNGAEAIWLAASGWQVTALDFSAAALEHAGTTARAIGADVAERIDWVEGDLGSWSPAPRHFDLVSCLYVHVSGSVAEMVTRLSSGVAPGGTLFVVGHLPVDPATGEPTPAAGQVQVTVEAAVGALDVRHWEVVVAEERPGLRRVPASTRWCGRSHADYPVAPNCSTRITSERTPTSPRSRVAYDAKPTEPQT